MKIAFFSARIDLRWHLANCTDGTLHMVINCNYIFVYNEDLREFIYVREYVLLAFTQMSSILDVESHARQVSMTPVLYVLDAHHAISQGSGVASCRGQISPKPALQFAARIGVGGRACNRRVLRDHVIRQSSEVPVKFIRRKVGTTGNSISL